MNHQLINKLLLIFLFVCISVFSQNIQHFGRIEGNVIDKSTNSPLIGANILISGNTIGAASDENGHFTIERVPIGNYSLIFKYIGYESFTKTDIIVRSERLTNIDVALSKSTLQSEEVLVTSSYFQKLDEQPSSNINFSHEEIRRAPGSAGDVSRILMSLPSVAKVNDQTNTLAVRGGSPIENTFYIDNIEIPNINHFPSQGASGGAIGMLNVDFIDDVHFYTGGFSSVYGDKLSSIMDISFREGTNKNIEGQLDLNFAGFGGIFEGPLFTENANFVFSARRSYIDFLIKFVDVGSSVAPTYGDLQSKLVYNIDKNNKLTLLGIFGDDHMNSDQQTGIDNKMVYYGDQDIYQSTIGLNWRSLWSSRGYSNTSISFHSDKYIEDFYETGTADQLIKNRSIESYYHFRNINYFKFNDIHSVKFGLELKIFNNNYNNWYSEYTDPIGNIVPSLTIDKDATSNLLGVYTSYIVRPTNHLSLTIGARADYFTYVEKLKLSPRFSFSYSFNKRTKLNGATGLFYQSLPAKLVVSTENKAELNIPVSSHFIIGIDHLLSANTQLTFEVYQKNYSSFPIDPNQNGIFIIDEAYNTQGFFFNTNELTDEGKAITQGVELTIQKKLAKDFYGLIGASYFRARYKGEDNIWRNRIYDNQIIFSIEGGYKPNYFWEFSLRWIYAGGRPYTPFNITESQLLNRGIIDENRINDERYDPYHSLNLRMDKRFVFGGSNMVVYISIWNVYNRKNVASIYWNQIENKTDIVYQWGILPIFGIEYEF